MASYGNIGRALSSAREAPVSRTRAHLTGQLRAKQCDFPVHGRLRLLATRSSDDDASGTHEGTTARNESLVYANSTYQLLISCGLCTSGHFPWGRGQRGRFESNNSLDHGPRRHISKCSGIMWSSSCQVDDDPMRGQHARCGLGQGYRYDQPSRSVCPHLGMINLLDSMLTMLSRASRVPCRWGDGRVPKMPRSCSEVLLGLLA